MKREHQISAKVRNTKRPSIHTTTMNILYSSFEAMRYDCPNNHGGKGHPCRNSVGDMHPAVVCADRRALEYIYRPGEYVTVRIGENGVKVI